MTLSSEVTCVGLNPDFLGPLCLRTGRSMRGCAWNCDQLLGITAIPPTAPGPGMAAADRLLRDRDIDGPCIDASALEHLCTLARARSRLP